MLMARSAPALLVLASLLPVSRGLAQTFDTAAAAAYSEKQNGHALLIYKDGQLLYEKYGNGWSTSKTIADPGKVFSYGPNPFQCFGEALRRILARQSKKETVDQYLHRRLLKPMGIQVAYWRNASTGEPDLPSGAFLTAREWIKFGEMIRRGGLVGSQRILKASSIAPCFQSTSVNRNYGVGWWLPGASPKLPADLRAAMGAGKQRLFVLPSLGMSIVRFGESVGYNWNDTRFFEILIPARHQGFGKGCAGSQGTPLLAGRSQALPVYGQTLGMDLARVPDKALGVLWLGLSHTRAGNLALPLDFQALVADAKANALGLTLSNGVESHIGLP